MQIADLGISRVLAAGKGLALGVHRLCMGGSTLSALDHSNRGDVVVESLGDCSAQQDFSFFGMGPVRFSLENVFLRS